MLEKIGKYEIRLQIGRGAMGTVYEGFDPVIGRRVAIKTLRTEMFEARQMPDILARFKREAQSAGRLSHPHVVTIHEYGEHEGTAYIVMEYIQGRELGHELNRGVRFPLDDVVRIMTQLLGALAHAHENKVVHRDLKPANMFVLDDGSLKVVDFGIAHVEASDLTDTGAMLGTPAYMSPEQCLGTQVDHRSDLFSAGVILYQLLTGDKPFTGSVTTIIQKVLRQEPLAPSELNPTLSPAWDKVVARAMAKKPEARFESAKHFAEAIKVAHSADRAHEDEGRRKAAEAEEHVQRTAEERSRAESLRRAEDERREAERRATAEMEARKAAEARARREAEERTVAIPKPRGSRAPAIAVAILVAAGVLGAVLYYRQSADEQTAKAEAVRVAAEARVREETEKRTKAEALAREEGDKRSKLEADAAKKETEAKREAELAAKTRAEEETKKAAEDKAKALVLKKEEEEKKKAEQAKKDAEEKAKAAVIAKQEAEEKSKTEAGRKAEEARKADEARRSAQKPGTVFQDCPDCPRMVVIPAGEFMMGSPASEEGRDAVEGPVHRIRIAQPFALGRNEVTVAEFRRFAEEARYKTEVERNAEVPYQGSMRQGCFAWEKSDGKWNWRAGRSWRTPEYEQSERHPAVCISWNDAQTFAKWLSQKTGKRYRLPTEAEWEYAARAGTASARYWGDDVNQACSYANVADLTMHKSSVQPAKHNCDDGHLFAAPVGSFRPNHFGLYDMIGNVWEWTQDCRNGNYEGAPADGAAWLTGDCTRRSSRGGGWYDEPNRQRSANRGNANAGHRSINTGFRIARTLE